MEALPGWSKGEVPAEHAIRGFHGVTLDLQAPGLTAEVLTGAFGFRAAGRDGDRERFHSPAGKLGAVWTCARRPEP